MCNSGKPRGSTRAEWCAKSRSRERAGKGLGRPANGKARAPFDGDRVRGCDCTPTLLTENMQIAPPFVGGPPHWPSHVHISPTKVLLATGGFPLMAFVVHSRETQKYTPRGNVTRYAHAGWYGARVWDRRGVGAAVPSVGADGAAGSLGQVARRPKHDAADRHAASPDIPATSSTQR